MSSRERVTARQCESAAGLLPDEARRLGDERPMSPEELYAIMERVEALGEVLERAWKAVHHEMLERRFAEVRARKAWQARQARRPPQASPG